MYFYFVLIDQFSKHTKDSFNLKKQINKKGNTFEIFILT